MNIGSLIGLVVGAAFAVGLALYMNCHRAGGRDVSMVTPDRYSIANIKLEMADIKSELKLMRGMLVAIVAGVAWLVAKAFW